MTGAAEPSVSRSLINNAAGRTTLLIRFRRFHFRIRNKSGSIRFNAARACCFQLALAPSGENMKRDCFVRVVNRPKGKLMAGKSGSADSIYKIVEVIGTSTKSWEDAGK